MQLGAWTRRGRSPLGVERRAEEEHRLHEARHHPPGLRHATAAARGVRKDGLPHSTFASTRQGGCCLCGGRCRTIHLWEIAQRRRQAREQHRSVASKAHSGEEDDGRIVRLRDDVAPCVVSAARTLRHAATQRPILPLRFCSERRTPKHGLFAAATAWVHTRLYLLIVHRP